MRILIFSLLIIFQFSGIAQSKLFNQSYDEFSSFDLDEEALQQHKQEGELMVFNEAKHQTKLAKTLFNKKTGNSHKEKIQNGKRVYEVIAEKEIMHYRINYIFLDGERMSKKAVERLRQKILGLLDTGIQFESLARQYSMDRNSYNGGDSGWFKEECTVPIFFEEINNPKLLANEVYSLELEEANWYYLVKKTYTPTSIREILIKITEE